jgi:predicted peroxiredoxin
MTEAIKGIASAIEGVSGYKCVEGKGHLDNCKDPRGVCETNSICRFIDEIKRRGKLDKKVISYIESNNIENGVNSKQAIELIFSLDYDIKNGNRVTINLISPTVHYFDIEKYKYNKILDMLDETLLNYVNDDKRYNVSTPFQAYGLISEILYKNKRKFTRLRRDLAKKIRDIIPDSIGDFFKLIMENGREMRIDQSLTIGDINKDDIYDNVKNYIDNIKKLLTREYESPNKHVFPILSEQFIAGTQKHSQTYKIKYPNMMYNGGLKNRSKRRHKNRSNRRHKNRSNRRHIKNRHTKKKKRHNKLSKKSRKRY